MACSPGTTPATPAPASSPPPGPERATEPPNSPTPSPSWAHAPRLLGYADARNPASAPEGAVRLVDAPLDEAVGRLVAHIRAVRPDIVIGHDALGQLTGHPDHRRAHQVTLLAVEAAALPHLYPEAGEPWQERPCTRPRTRRPVWAFGPLLQSVGKTLLTVPDAYVTTTVDVSPWAATKMEAILAHRSEAARERPLPGLLARLPEPERAEIIRTEQFTRLTPGPVPGDPDRLSWPPERLSLTPGGSCTALTGCFHTLNGAA